MLCTSQNNQGVQKELNVPYLLLRELSVAHQPAFCKGIVCNFSISFHFRIALSKDVTPMLQAASWAAVHGLMEPCPGQPSSTMHAGATGAVPVYDQLVL